MKRRCTWESASRAMTAQQNKPRIIRCPVRDIGRKGLGPSHAVTPIREDCCTESCIRIPPPTPHAVGAGRCSNRDGEAVWCTRDPLAGEGAVRFSDLLNVKADFSFGVPLAITLQRAASSGCCQVHPCSLNRLRTACVSQ
jgi:hypothetical protein